MPVYKKPVQEEEQEEEIVQVKKSKVEEGWQVIKVETAYDPAIVNEITGEQLLGKNPIETLILLDTKLLNEVQELKRLIKS